MRALLKKDAVWLIAFAVAGVALRLAVMIGTGNEEVWVDRDDHAYSWAAYSSLALAAALLGVFSVLHEDVRRTRAYLLHRPVSFRTVFLARHLGCAAVLLIWMLVPPALHFLGWWLFSDNRVILDGGRFAPHWLVDLAALPAYAAGCFAATLSRRVWVLLLAGSAFVIAVVGVFATAVMSLYGEGETPAAWVYLPLGVATMALLLAGSYHAERRLDDPDQPWPLRRLLWLGLPLLVPTTVAATLAVQELQHEAQQQLFRQYPAVARTPDGAIRLLRLSAVEKVGGQLVEVDDAHQLIPGAPRFSFEQETLLWMPIDHRRSEEGPRQRRPASLFRRHMQTIHCGRSNRCYLDDDEGLVNITQYAGEERRRDEIFRVVLGKGPQNQPFSVEAQVLGNHYGPRSSIVVWEPGEHTLWSYRLGSRATHFERVELPGGDRPVDVACEPRAERWTSSWNLSGDHLAMQGERGFYDWTGQAFAPATPERARALAAEASLRAAERASPAVRSDPTVFGHTVEIPGTNGGGPGFRHTFAPRTWREQGLAAFIVTLSAVRPPALQVASALLPRYHEDLFATPTALDPLPGSLGWVLALDLALGGALAALCLLRLRRLGASRAHQIFWVSAVALLGLLAFLCYRLLETRRAWRPLPAAEPAPPLLIATA